MAEGPTERQNSEACAKDDNLFGCIRHGAWLRQGWLARLHGRQTAVHVEHLASDPLLFGR